MNGEGPDGGLPGTGPAWRATPWLLLLLAAGLRLPRLDLRPLHHDEGTNVIFLLRLLREGVYQYDPSNYHGPLLYVLSVVPLFLCGTTTVTLRLTPALLGTLMAVLPWFLRRELGRAGAIASGVLLAVSPSLVYYSRDNIHEIYLGVLTLLLVTVAARGAVSGRTTLFALAGAAAGGMLATKETACLTFLALGAGLLVSKGAGLPKPGRAAALALFGTACFLALVFYSDFFTDLAALVRPFEAIRLWGARGVRADGHGKPWWYYLAILGREEPAIVATAVAGTALALWTRDRFATFLAGWSGATLLAYSAIPYKTPWLVLNAVLPMALLGGTVFTGGPRAMDAAGEGRPGGARRRLACLLLVLGAGISARRAYVLSFVRYDDDRTSALVYVQTRRDVNRLVARVEEFAQSRPEGRDLPIEVLSPDYLPLNWYLRDFTDVSYFGKVTERPGAPVVIARSDAADQVEALLGPGYTRAIYPLRPGVDLCLFLREATAPPASPGERPPGRL
jgi:uncharacterized protein (TIGR03663 family)